MPDIGEGSFGVVGIGRRTHRGHIMPSGVPKQLYYRPDGAALLLPINYISATDTRTGGTIKVDYFLNKGFTLTPPKKKGKRTNDSNVIPKKPT